MPSFRGSNPDPNPRSLNIITVGQTTFPTVALNHSLRTCGHTAPTVAKRNLCRLQPVYPGSVSEQVLSAATSTRFTAAGNRSVFPLDHPLHKVHPNTQPLRLVLDGLSRGFRPVSTVPRVGRDVLLLLFTFSLIGKPCLRLCVTRCMRPREIVSAV